MKIFDGASYNVSWYDLGIHFYRRDNTGVLSDLIKYSENPFPVLSFEKQVTTNAVRRFQTEEHQVKEHLLFKNNFSVIKAWI